MCYSTRQTRERKELEKLLSVKAMYGDLDTDLELIYFHANGWSHPVMWTLGQEEPNNMLPAMWGIMPPKEKQENYTEYFKNPKTFGGLNAKSEKLFDHFVYRYCWENQRCIIPVDGFFEPHNTKVKVKGKDFKVPFYFRRKNGDPLYLAGIYTNTADGRRTFAVLTKDATPMFEEIHNEKKRRPVIIDDENLDAWLHNGNNESDVQDLIDDDLWEGDLEAYPVTKDLYSRTVDSNYPGIIDKVEYEEVSISYD
ncbi:SOS response-associated peptidase [Flagellimonas zhangzhouensis]|uniref:Abasic site processing protein n=1 Tax=Flagellimonas zhangzhouensis TaxID=1073328 RepID=A0A1H2XRU4_9FLAO|nr:SOS response-associated peptidase family protein [Allomuricauda zhangzhouensis]SDQ90725.1 Putative SOS response-associated peptidase YedK [Allomuricauda zhangzhouensis]SDW95490.1 Putative SOS response-associated peptidase YedK [Allomuricauda zhangzhouensis]